MEGNVGADDTVNVSIRNLATNGEVLRGVSGEQVKLETPWVNGLVEAGDADHVEAVVEATNADGGLRC